MWYATQQPRQQFVLEEAIAYDEPLAGLGALGREGRYARAMRNITAQRRGRVIVPEGQTVESLKAAYSPAAYAKAAQARAQQTQAIADVNAQIGAQTARSGGRQFAEDRLQDPRWQDPRLVEMMTPDASGWAQLSFGPGIGKEAYEARVAGQKEAKTTKFLQSQAGAAWAKTPEGKAWGKSEAGQKWQAGVVQKFVESGTPAAAKWVQTTAAGQKWAVTPAGQKLRQEKEAAKTIAELTRNFQSVMREWDPVRRRNLIDGILATVSTDQSGAVRRWYAGIAPHLKIDPSMVFSVQQGGG